MGKASQKQWKASYLQLEQQIHKGKSEAKYSKLSDRAINRLFEHIKDVYKFAIVINEENLPDAMFQDKKYKKHKQRYLDRAYIHGVKEAFRGLLLDGLVKSKDIKQIAFMVDEHSTTTKGIYELREGLEEALQTGYFRGDGATYTPAVCKHVQTINLTYSKSDQTPLVRAADILAGKIRALALQGDYEAIKAIPNLYVTFGAMTKSSLRKSVEWQLFTARAGLTDWWQGRRIGKSLKLYEKWMLVLLFGIMLGIWVIASRLWMV